MAAIVLVALFLRWRGRLYDSDWFHRICLYATPIGFLAVLAGWTTTEVGRQPWTVYGLMRTADSVTPSLTATDVVASLLGYIVVYLIMFPAGAFLMARIVRAGFVAAPTKEQLPEPVAAGVPRAPVVAPPGAAP
jgi:cytochrome d ubiquinol oxidase subunit I